MRSSPRRSAMPPTVGARAPAAPKRTHGPQRHAGLSMCVGPRALTGALPGPWPRCGFHAARKAGREIARTQRSTPVNSIKVEQLLKDDEFDLGLTLLAGEPGLARVIDHDKIQKPGLAFTGYTDFVKP